MTYHILTTHISNITDSSGPASCIVCTTRTSIPRCSTAKTNSTMQPHCPHVSAKQRCSLTVLMSVIILTALTLVKTKQPCSLTALTLYSHYKTLLYPYTYCVLSLQLSSRFAHSGVMVSAIVRGGVMVSALVRGGVMVCDLVRGCVMVCDFVRGGVMVCDRCSKRRAQCIQY